MTFAIGHHDTRRAFTLIELILVLALLVIITSMAVPHMASFIRGRALDSEARRLMAVMHVAQSRAVSEGMPMMLWMDEKGGSYGYQAETSGQNGDPKAEKMNLDSTLGLSVSTTATAPVTFQNLPAIKFLADGTIDENSPQTLKLVDADGFSRTFQENSYHTGYEVFDSTGQQQ
jgi:type II secretion system protein H